MNRNLIRAAQEEMATFYSKRSVISSWDALIEFCELSIVPDARESFNVIFLDTRNCLIESVEMAQGTINHVAVYPREIARIALEKDANAVILVHNHPSGSTSPSAADKKMTKQIVDALKVFDIVVHDHVIVGAIGNAYSMRASGDMRS